jgi:hypothetical protein
MIITGLYPSGANFNQFIIASGANFGLGQDNYFLALGETYIIPEVWEDDRITWAVPYGSLSNDFKILNSNGIVLATSPFTVLDEEPELMYITVKELTRIPKKDFDFSVYATEELEDIIKDISSEINTLTNMPDGWKAKQCVEEVSSSGTDRLYLQKYCAKDKTNWVFTVENISVALSDITPGLFLYNLSPDELLIHKQLGILEANGLIHLASTKNESLITVKAFPENSRVKVIYTAGYSQVPRSLKYLCKIMCMRRLAQQSYGFMAGQIEEASSSGLKIKMSPMTSYIKAGFRDDPNAIIERIANEYRRDASLI